MRVLSLIPGLDPARGGMATAATNMMLAARKAGVDLVVAVPDHGADDPASRALVDELQRAGVGVHTLPIVGGARRATYRWGISPAQATWTARHVREFDVVHVHGIYGIGPISGLLAGSAARRPVVVTAHESLTAFGIDGSRSPARRHQKELVKAMYLRLAALFVLTSELETRDSLPAAAMRRTVHYPVTDASWQSPAVIPRGRRDTLTIGFLARIDPKKNLATS